MNFQYVPRISDAIRTTFAGGMALVDSKLLQAVEMRGPGNTLARRYELGYASSASTGRLQLAEIAECADVGGPCKPPTRFTWNNPPSGFDDIETDLPFPQYEGASVITTDWDGNGLDDIVTIDGEPSGVPVSRFYTARNVGAAEGYFRHPYTSAFFLDFNVYPTAIRERGTPIDFNHDGRQDLFLHDMNGNSTRWKVLQTNALGQFSMVDTGVTRPFPGGQNVPMGLKGPDGSAHLLDMDGDGMADLVACTSNGNGTGYSWTYRAWTELGFSPSTEQIPVLDIQPCDSEAYVVDIDGDGKTELLVRDLIFSGGAPVYLNDYTAIIRVGPNDYTSVQQNMEAVPAGGAMFFLDTNGDGLTDAVQTGYSDRQPYVFINTGRGFLPRVNGLPTNVLPADDFAQFATTIDFDNDGRQDLLLPMMLANAGGIPSWRVLRSKGNGTFTIQTLSDVPFDAVLMQGGVSLAHPYAPRVMEADGDGANDILLPQSATNSFHVYRNRAKFTDTLATITDGMAPHDPVHPAFRPQVAIEYGTLAGNPVYEKGEDCEYPIRCAAGPRRVVAAYELDTAGVAPRRSEFTYRDARYHRLGRGFLGFAERVMRDPDTNAGRLEIYDHSTFDTSFSAFPFAHRPSEVISWTPTRDEHELVVELSFQSTTFQVAPTTNGASYFTLPVITRTRREQGRNNMVAWAFEFGGNYEAYARAAYAGTTDTVRLSDTINTLLNFDVFGNVLEEKTITGREFNLFGGPLDAQADVIERSTRTFKNNVSKWQIGLLQTDEQCSTANGGGGSACRTTERTYDSSARVKSSTNSALGDLDTWVQLGFTYDSFGNVTSTRADDAYGGKRVSCTSYESEGVYPYAQGNPEGHLTFTKFHAGFGRPIAAIDPNGRITQWALDEYGRVILEKRPDGTETSTTVTRTQDGGPQQDEYVVRISSATPGWGQEQVELDRMGRTIRQSSRGTTIDGTTQTLLQQTIYDDRGEFVARTLVPIDETAPSVDRKYHRYWRDNLGRVVRHETPWGGTTKTTFDGVHVRVEPPGIPATVTEIDSLGRPIRVVDAKMGNTSYTYGPFGYLLTVIDPGGAITTTNRDAFGRVRTSSDPDRGTTTIHYSGYGEARSTLDALGREAQFTYDRLGRLVRRIDPDGETQWNYDIAPNGIGALANVVSPTGVIRRFGYDARGRMASTDTSINGEVFTVGFGYDAQSRLSQITYPAINGTSFVVENHYDDTGHLVRVNELGQPTDLWALTDVNPNGFISGEQFGNKASQGARTKRTYDEDHGLVTSIATMGQVPLQSLSYEYDDLLNLSTRTDHLQGVPGRVETFTYDQLQRLRCASFDGESECTREWRYSANGNLTVSPTAGTYTYDPARPHTVDNTNAGSYAHDAVGNQIGRPDSTVQYTALDLPKRIDWTNGDVTTFDYDGNRARVRKTSGLLESIFVGEWYERVTNAGVQEHRHYIRSSERVVAVVTKSAVGTKTQFLHSDNLGSVDVVSTSTGTLEEQRSYDPFGTRRNPEWGKPPGTFTSSTTLGFTGHFGDEELGLVFMRGRVYDPGLGRFLTPDPFVSNAYSGESWHRYAYVENNPLKYTDPSGFTADENALAQSPPEASKPPPVLTVWVIGERPPWKKEAPPEALGAMRTPTDLSSIGDMPGLILDPPASGSERDHADNHNVMLEVLGGAASAYGRDVLTYAAGTVVFVIFPPAYFAWQGYNFWSNIASGGIEGYRQDGVFGAIAGAINAINPFAHVGISLAQTIDAAQKGDYAGAGEHGYRTAVGLAGIAAAAIGGGIGKGGGGRGAVALDTNALIAAVEKGQASTILGGRSPIVPITVAKEFLRGGGSAGALRTFLSNNGGRLGLAGSESSVGALQNQATGMGRVLHLDDARVVAGATREGLPLVTNDLRLGNFLQAAKLPFERF